MDSELKKTKYQDSKFARQIFETEHKSKKVDQLFFRKGEEYVLIDDECLKKIGLTLPDLDKLLSESFVEGKDYIMISEDSK